MQREGREQEKSKEEKRERGGNACDICFQKVIPPTLSTSNPNVVSGVKSFIVNQATGNKPHCLLN